MFTDIYLPADPRERPVYIYHNVLTHDLDHWTSENPVHVEAASNGDVLLQLSMSGALEPLVSRPREDVEAVLEEAHELFRKDLEAGCYWAKVHQAWREEIGLDQ
jgi:hypothetical protein